MKLNKKRIIYTSLILIIGVILIYLNPSYNPLKKQKNQDANNTVHDITKMSFYHQENNLLLLYPSMTDSLPEEPKEGSHIVEIERGGEVVKEQIIKDVNFSSVSLTQKTNRPQTLYLSLDDQFANHFFTFDLEKKRIQKENVNYFNYDVMMVSASHQGEDIWFWTNTSYKTGTQTYVEDKGISRTISNFNEQTMYETPPEHPPATSPILEMESQVAYASAGATEGPDEDRPAMVFLDRVTGKHTVYQGKEHPYEYNALHTDGKNAYFTDNLGRMYKIDLDGNMIEKSFEVIENVYSGDLDPIRMVNEKEGYQIARKYIPETSLEEFIMLKWTFGDTFSVEKIDLPFWNDNNLYRYLYYNPLLKRSYLIEVDTEENMDNGVETGKLLILDETFSLIESIRIKHPFQLDLVIE